MRAYAAAVVFALAFTGAAPAAADAASHDERRLGYAPAWEVPLTVALTAYWVGTEIAKPRLAAPACRVCGTNRFDAWFADRLAWTRPERAQGISDVLLYGLAPAAASGSLALGAIRADRPDRLLYDLLLVAEAAAITAALNQTVKLVVGRRRPLASGDGHVPHPDDNLSFYSGHAAMTFTLAASAWTVARMRGDPSARVTAWIAFPIAVATGWLRVAGDKHHFTDVLVGAAVGTATGILVPALHDRGAFLRTQDGTGMAASSLGPVGGVGWTATRPPALTITFLWP